MLIFDISMGISEDMIFYPGDPKFQLTRFFSIPKDSVNLSKVEFGVHTGTHVDAPLHFVDNALNITDFPLTKFYGPASVLDLTNINYGAGISSRNLSKFTIHQDDIVLFKTKNSMSEYKEFKHDFVYLTKEGATYLVKKKIKAVGIDYLSIEKFDSEKPETHLALLNHDVIIFEGLNLSKIKPGRYIFAGFPLKITGAEGAPVRAVLIQLEGE
ncbi:MAG: cyclase family protein [Candidatus Hermodarchaeota archaeon]